MFLGSSLRQIIFQHRTKGCGLVVAGPICGEGRGLGGRGKKGERGFETVLVRASRQNGLSVRDRGQRQRHTSVRRSHSGRRPAGVHPAAAAATDNKASVSTERRHSNVDGAQRDLSILRAATFHRQAFETQQGGRRDEAA